MVFEAKLHNEEKYLPRPAIRLRQHAPVLHTIAVPEKATYECFEDEKPEIVPAKPARRRLSLRRSKKSKKSEDGAQITRSKSRRLSLRRSNKKLTKTSNAEPDSNQEQNAEGCFLIRSVSKCRLSRSCSKKNNPKSKQEVEGCALKRTLSKCKINLRKSPKADKTVSKASKAPLDPTKLSEPCFLVKSISRSMKRFNKKQEPTTIIESDNTTESEEESTIFSESESDNLSDLNVDDSGNSGEETSSGYESETDSSVIESVPFGMLFIPSSFTGQLPVQRKTPIVESSHEISSSSGAYVEYSDGEHSSTSRHVHFQV